MSVLKTAWANLQDGLGNRFSWSHVKAIFYNYAEQKLLSTKLDEMDALIDEKIAKAMMSNVQVNDETKVPTSALAYSMSQDISQNAQDITQLYSDKASKSETMIIFSSMPSGIESALSFASNYPNAIAPYTGRGWTDMGSPWNNYYGFIRTEGYYSDASGGWFYFSSSDGSTTKKRFFTASGWKTDWI